MARDVRAELEQVQQDLEDARNVVAGADEMERRLVEDQGAPEDDEDLVAVREVSYQARQDIPMLESRLTELLQVLDSAAATAQRSPRSSFAAGEDSGSLSDASLADGTAKRDRGGMETQASPGRRDRDPSNQDIDRDEVDSAAFQLVNVELDSLSSATDAGNLIRTMDTIVERLEDDTALRYELQIERYLTSILTCLADSMSTEVRAATYRLLRHLVVDANDAAKLNQYHLEYFLVKTLARDARHDFEKEHALRLVRAVIEHAGSRLHEASDIIPLSVLRAVIAVAEATEEKLRLSALELLGELIVRNLPLLVVSGGLRTVLEALSEGLPDFGAQVAPLFLVAVDHPETRQWLRPGVDLEVVLAGFTEVYGSGALVLEKVRASAGIVAMLLKSWSGLFYLNISGRQAVTSLVDSLSNPSAAIREVLLDMLIDVFSVRGQDAVSATKARGSISVRDRCNLLDQYLAILLLVFAEAGLPDALSTLATDPQATSTSKKVSRLISIVLEVAQRVLPPSHAMRVQALPKLVALTLTFDTSDARRFASSTLLSVDDSKRRHRRSLDLLQSVASTRLAGSSVAKQLAATQRQRLTQTRRAAASKIDDITFRNLLLESEVLSNRSEVPWRCDILLSLVDGPLRDPKRLEETTRATKFMTRLLGFFHPYSLRFSDMPRSRTNAQWTKLGCSLLETLLESQEGFDYLAEDQLLRQIAESLFQVEAAVGASGIETVFSRDRVERTLTRDYFKLIGVLTRSERGTRLLDQARMFTAVHRLAELRNRDDLVILTLESMNYMHDGHTRVFLGRALTSSFRHIRLVATRHLAQLLTAAADNAAKGVPDWLVRLLVQQLYDSATDVVKLAMSVLEDICQDDDVLEQVLALQPALELVGEHSAELLKRFLATPTGVRYLDNLDYIRRELDAWFDERNLQYMVEVELALASVFSQRTPHAGSSAPFNGTPPPHFYGELVQTAEGCRHLRESGHLDDFAAILSIHEDSELDQEYVIMLKAVLWALGHVGSSSPGLLLLDEYDILTQIVQIAAFSPVYSLRGTATFALCLLASTEEGAEMLDEMGWDSVFDLHGRAVGLCVPSYLADYIASPQWDVPPAIAPLSLSFSSPRSTAQRDILIAMADLSNHILAAKASKTLAKIKSRHPADFRSPVMLRRAYQMLSEHQFRLVSRRFVLDLFDVPLSSSLAGELAGAGFDLLRASHAAVQTREPSPSSSPAIDAQVAGLTRTRWQASGIAESLLTAVEGDVGSDDDGDDTSDVSVEGQTASRVLTPIVTIRGFLLA